MAARAAKWEDNEYVISQARQRLHMVLPGENPFVVVDPARSQQDRPDRDPGRARRRRGPARQTVVERRGGGLSMTSEFADHLDPATDEDLAVVAAQLGRTPRGTRAVAHRCPCGLPDVVETTPRLPDGTPFPTLFYLTCPRAVARSARLEPPA